MQINATSPGAIPASKVSSSATETKTYSPLVEARLELEESVGTALNETMEELSMVLSGKAREVTHSTRSERLQHRRQILVDMLSAVDLEQLSQWLASLQQEENKNPEFDTIRLILALSAQLVSGGLSPAQLKARRQQLDSLLERDGWEIALFGLLELSTIHAATLAPIKRLFQETKEKTQDKAAMSLAEWFQRIATWSQRRQRVAVLLRAMAFELSACNSPSHQQRLATVVSSLRRLLIFLALEDECFHQEQLCALPHDSLLPLVIEIIGQRWLFDDWMSQQLHTLVSSTTLRQRLLHHLDSLFTLLPDPCFSDDEQREQILTVFRELKAAAN